MKPVHSWQEDLPLAKDALKARDVPLHPAHQARLWAQIEQAQTEDALVPMRRWPAALIMVAATATVGVLLWAQPDPNAARVLNGQLLASSDASPPFDSVPLKVPLTAAEPTEVQLPRGRLQLATDTRFWLTSTALVRLDEGDLTLLPAPGVAEPTVIVVDHTRVQSLGGRIRLHRTPTHTQVSTEGGPAQMQSGTNPPRTLDTNTTHTIRAVVPPPAAPLASKTAPAPVLAPEPAPAPPAAARAPPSKRKKSSRKISTQEAERKVEQARRLTRRDAPRARAIVQEVLNAKPEAPVRVAAWMVLGDAQRREGQWDAAAQTYARVANSPAVGAFLEEALLRRAQMLQRTGRRARAMLVLETAHRRVASPLLLPERTALQAQLFLATDLVAQGVGAQGEGAQGEGAQGLERALEILEPWRDHPALVLHRTRLDVAERWLETHPDQPHRVRPLIDAVLRHAPDPLLERARRLERVLKK